MRLAQKVQDWIASKDIYNRFEEDEEDQTSMFKFDYKIKGQRFQGVIETHEKYDLIKAYIYAPFSVLPNKINEFSILLNKINSVGVFGCVSVIEEGIIRWNHSVDFENTHPSTEAINNLFFSGGDVFRTWFDEMTKVALTDITAQEIFDKLDEKA